MLAGACWDGTIFVWKVDYNMHVSQSIKAQTSPMMSQNVQVPILGLCWQEDAVGILLACADNQIRKYDLNSN